MEDDGHVSCASSVLSPEEKMVMVLGPPVSGKTTFIFSLLPEGAAEAKKHVGVQCVKLSGPQRVQVWEGDIRVFQQLGKRLSAVLLVFDTARPSQQVELYDNFRPLVQSLGHHVSVTIIGNKRGDVDEEKLRENARELFGATRFSLVDFTDRAGVQRVFADATSVGSILEP